MRTGKTLMRKPALSAEQAKQRAEVAVRCLADMVRRLTRQLDDLHRAAPDGERHEAGLRRLDELLVTVRGWRCDRFE
jgi:hypothetical protein